MYKEAKVGIAMSRSYRRSEEHYLYEMEMLRLKEGVDFLIDINEESILASQEIGAVQEIVLGAEGKRWTVTKVRSADEMKSLSKKAKITSNNITVILLTPLILNRSVQEHLVGFGLTPTKVITDKPDLFGGWDMVRKRPKKRYKMLSAGTVIYCERNESIDGIIRLGDKDLKKQGFGLALVIGT